MLSDAFDEPGAIFILVQFVAHIFSGTAKNKHEEIIQDSKIAIVIGYDAFISFGAVWMTTLE